MRDLTEALANAAAVGLIGQRAEARAETVAEQLQHALDSRVIIEQAKGILAHRADVAPQDAFLFLRGHARNHGLKLTELAERIQSRAPGTTE